MNKSYVLTAISIMIAYIVCSQSEAEPFNTDRPDQSNTPWLVPAHGFQLETGFIMEKDHSNGSRVTQYSLNNTLLKYGINEFCEIRIKADYLNKRDHYTGYSINGFGKLGVGLKIKLANAIGILPQAALLTHFSLKSEDQYNAPGNSAIDITLCFTHNLKNWSLSHNWGTEWVDEKNEMVFYSTLSVGYNLTTKLAAFIENYNYYQHNREPDFRLDGGITFDIMPNAKLDLSGGVGLSEDSPGYFISSGVSFRFLRASRLANKLH